MAIQNKHWYLLQGQTETGPYSASDLRHFAAVGKLSKTDKIRPAASDKWYKASSVKNLFDALDSKSFYPRASNTNGREANVVKPENSSESDFDLGQLVPIYACQVSPAVFLLYVFLDLWLGNSFEDISPLRGAEIGSWIAMTLNSLMVTAIIFVGGLKWQRNNSHASVTLMIGISLSLFLGLTSLIQAVATMSTAEDFDYTTTSTIQGVTSVLFLLVIAIPDFVFQVVLIRYLGFKKIGVNEIFRWVDCR